MESRDIISGKEQGAAAGLIRLLLCFLTLLYEPIIRLRNWLYDHQWLKSTRLSVPVICVGNLTAGGTGKTPMVIWLCQRLQTQGKKVAILSRGYKSRTDSDNDENKLLQQALPKVAIVVDANRVQGGRRAIEQHQADVLVMDDGFQHRRLARDLDIVMIDATCPFGYEKLLPAGLLREPVSQLKRADAVVLSRSDQIEFDQLAKLQNRIGELARANSNAETLLLQSEHRPVALFNAQNESRPCEQLKDQRVFAFCGIGQPHSFEKTIIGLGAKVIGQHFFADHHKYSPADLTRLAPLAQSQGAEMIVTTEKDWVKISTLCKNLPIPLYWLKVEMDMTRGSDELNRILETL